MESKGESGPPCGGPFVHRIDHSSYEHARRQITANEPQQVLVLHPFGHQTHQDVVVHSIEELLQIKIDDDVAAVSNELLCGGHGLMRRASGPEPIARRREGRIPLLLQHLHHRLLDEAVEHRWDVGGIMHLMQ